MRRRLPDRLRRAGQSLTYLWQHPLSRGERLAALWRYGTFHLRQARRPRTESVPFVAGTRLHIRRGQAGLVANHYVHLADVEEMAFLLHLLRPDDAFVDIGANGGAYSVLAAGVVGARTVAVEPAPGTRRVLRDNLELNGLSERCRVVEAAVGATPGEVRITAGQGAMNHVTDRVDGSVVVPLVTVDDLCRDGVPTLIKVDVEGYEAAALAGARRTLSDRGVLAVIVELNGSGEAYGWTDADVDAGLRAHGLRPVRYDPVRRRVTPTTTWNRVAYNTIYARDLDAVRSRVAAAPTHRISPRHRL